jgi:hypothetical protein
VTAERVADQESVLAADADPQAVQADLISEPAAESRLQVTGPADVAVLDDDDDADTQPIPVVRDLQPVTGRATREVRPARMRGKGEAGPQPNPAAAPARKRPSRDRRAAARRAASQRRAAARVAGLNNGRARPDPRAIAADEPTVTMPALRPSSFELTAALREAETQEVSAHVIRRFAARRAVEDLCKEFASVCESAVDPLEIASALEFDGISDSTVAARYGCPDVFTLADEMYRRVPRRPAEPDPQSDPWQQLSSWRPALRGMLYGLPGVCFPAGAGLLAGPGVPPTLIVALLVSWSLSQGLAYLGYRRLGTPDGGRVHQLLLAGLAIGIALVAIALAAVGHIAHPQLSVLVFGLGEGIYMLSASLIMVLGVEQWLLVALAPGVLGSAVFLLLGRPLGGQHAVWWALAATPILGLALAVGYAGHGWRASRARRSAMASGPLFRLDELRGAWPAAAFGLVAGGLLVFPVAAGPNGHGGVNAGALLAALPLTLSMGAAEWSLLWYRRRIQRALRNTADLRGFADRARLTLYAAVSQYILGAAALIVLAAFVADKSGLLQYRGPYLAMLVAYLELGTAMFLALLLQAVGDRAVPLIACSVALAAEIIGRGYGRADELTVCASLYLVLAAYATWTQRSAVRYAY